MFESDLLLLIFLIVLFIYLKSLTRDFYKYRELFRNIKGPKTLPLGLIAYLFTARSESGTNSWVKVPRGLINATLWALTDRFQILQSLSKKYPNFYS